MTYSEQLEREAERNRADIEDTLDELRARMRPGRLVDQLVDYARDGAGAQFYDNLKKQVVENPLPVTVIGAGLAWLAISGAMAHRRHADGATGNGDWRGEAGDRLHGAEAGVRRFGDGISDTAHEATDALGERYRSATDAASEGIERVRTRARVATAAMSDRASAAYGSASDAAGRAADTVGESVSRARHGIAEASQALADFSREQPLVMAALGVAIGAALGAALPSTEAESRVMGDAAEGARSHMRSMVDEGADRLKETARDVADRATSNLKEDVEDDSESALDRMDRDSEETPDDQRSADSDDYERRFTAGNRPSNG